MIGDGLPAGTRVLIGGRPHVVSAKNCRACHAPAFIPAHMQPGGLLVCSRCAHVVQCQQSTNPPNPTWPHPRGTWYVVDLTPAEAETVANHPNFPNIRRMQEQMAMQLGLWG